MLARHAMGWKGGDAKDRTLSEGPDGGHCGVMMLRIKWLRSPAPDIRGGAREHDVPFAHPGRESHMPVIACLGCWRGCWCGGVAVDGMHELVPCSMRDAPDDLSTLHILFQARQRRIAAPDARGATVRSLGPRVGVANCRDNMSHLPHCIQYVM